MRVECVVPSCSAREENNYQFLLKTGWRRIVPKKEANPPARRAWPDYYAWCPDCSKHFSVES
jgi:hypothetical protein